MKNYYELLKESSIEDIEHYQNLLINAVRENVTDEKIDNIISEALGSQYKNLLQPIWLKSNFDDDIWEIFTEKDQIKVLNFKKAIIGDENLLIDDRKLVNTFKYWIIASLSPMLSKSELKRKTTIQNRINTIVSLINCIIIKSKQINLYNRKTLALDCNFFTDILVNYSKYGSSIALFNSNKTISNFLEEAIKNIDINEVILFEKKYPLINSNYEDGCLELTLNEIRLSRFYLYNENAYPCKRKKLIDVNYNYFSFLFKNKIISENYPPLPLFQLRLEEDYNNNEFPAVPVKSDPTEGISKKQTLIYIKAITDLKLLNNFNNCYHIDHKNIELFSLKYLENIVEYKESKRYLTPQADVVFDCIKKSFEFLIKYLDDILESIFNILILRKKYDPRPIKKFLWNECLTHKLRNNGTCLIEIPKTDPDYYNKLRKNNGLIDLYDIAIGSTLLLIGATMARRQGEILDLDTNLCLYPQNLDPSTNKNTNFYLIFENRKSGITLHNLETRETLNKPILRSVAAIIYKFQAFNKKLKSHQLIEHNNNSLFNSINNSSLKLNKLDRTNYYRFTDKFCDYIETPTVLYRNNTHYRYYLKQHQLRRFFALMFFWSNAYDGLDTLRNFLGHTDAEHLYHYITTE
ncbi:hypothetical protein HMPREF0017_01029, partial [Acinetobacter lwoffii SH145]|uniref:hypothetical protein n=1 Tax=Acinetobacter lwoffii TaxID=28090 RepID=UPI0001BBA927